MVKGRTSMGRQKIEMKRIEREEARSVCFSKRRQGMFKKASELSILCGAMVAIVSFSPAGRPFSFGSPSFKSVINRFLALIGPATSGESCDSSSGETNITIKESLECSELEQSIEDENKRKERLKEAIERDMDGCLMGWLTTEACPSGLDELYEIQKKLLEIQDVVKEKIKQVLQEEGHPTRSYPPRFMDLASKYQLDMKIATPISSVTPNYNHGYADELDANYSSTSGAQAIGTSVNCPDELDG